MKNKWPTKILGDVLINIQNGCQSKQSEEGNLPVTRIETLQNSELDLNRVKYVDINEKEFQKYRYLKDDIIFSHINSFEKVGKSAIYEGVPKNLIHGLNLLRFQCNTKLCEPKYLFYFLCSGIFRRRLEPFISRAVNQASVNQTNLKKILVELPPLLEQKKIVEKLDAIRRAQELCDTQIQKAEELFESIIFESIIRKSESYKLRTIRDIASMVGSGSTPRGGKEVYKTSGINFIRSQNVLMNDLDFSDIVFIDKEIHDKMKRTKVKKKDILLNITGASIGRVAIYPGKFGEANVNQHVCIIRINNDNIPEYIVYYLSSRLGQNQIWKEQAGGTRQGLNFEQVKNLVIRTPNLSKQREIVGNLEAVRDYKKLLLQQKSLMKELFDSVLYKSMNGEMDN